MALLPHTYIKLYKPYGYLSQFVNHQNKRRSKKLLGELIPQKNLMAVGRLDEKSEGLLLLTTDGKFSASITNHSVEKEYHVMVDGQISDEAIARLKDGVVISVNSQPYTTKPCLVKHLYSAEHIVDRFVRDERHGTTSWLSITLREGKFRQIRKMTAKVGFPTLRLVRVRIGHYTLGDLQPGDYEPINSGPF